MKMIKLCTMREDFQQKPRNIELSITDRKSKKMKFYRFVFLLINIVTVGVIIYVGISKGNVGNINIIFELMKSNKIWLLLALLCAFGVVLFDGLGYTMLLKSKTGKVARFGIKTAIVGRYGDAITPLGTGGQPFQMYYLKMKGVKLNYACAMPLVKYIVRVITGDVVMVTLLLICWVNTEKFMLILAIIGLALNTVIPLLMLMFAYRRNLAEKVIESVVKFLYKIKIIKKSQNLKDKWLEPVESLAMAMRELSSNFKQVISLVVFAIFENICYLILPYLVSRFVGQSPNVFEIVGLTIIIHNAASFMPTPGASGVTDLAFYTVFSSVLSGDTVLLALLVWRMISFYLYVILGFLILIFTKKSENIELLNDKFSEDIT